MSAIGPGDWVECVHVQPRFGGSAHLIPDLDRLRVGAPYLVVEAFEAWDGPTLILAEVRSSVPDGGWWAGRFRPIGYRSEAGAFDHLLTTIPANTPEPA